MKLETIDELAALLMYIDDLIFYDEYGDKFMNIGGKQIPYRKEYQNINNAVEMYNDLVEEMNTSPMWKDGRHEGDCIKVAQTCIRW